MKEVKVKLELRGDDIEMLDKALSFIPVENEDVISYLSYLKSSFNEESVNSDENEDEFKLEDDLIDDDFNEDDEDVESDDDTDDDTDDETDSSDEDDEEADEEKEFINEFNGQPIPKQYQKPTTHVNAKKAILSEKIKECSLSNQETVLRCLLSIIYFKEDAFFNQMAGKLEYLGVEEMNVSDLTIQTDDLDVLFEDILSAFLTLDINNFKEANKVREAILSYLLYEEEKDVD